MVDQRLSLAKDAFRAKKPHLAEKTLNNYASCILVLFKAVIGKSAPMFGLDFVRDRKQEIENYVCHNNRFVASKAIYFSTLILASQCLEDKTLEDEYRHLNNLAIEEQNQLRKRQGESTPEDNTNGKKSISWPTFRDLVTNKAILERVLKTVFYNSLPFKPSDFRLLVFFHLVYAFLVHNADIMAPRFQVLFDTELVLVSKWPPNEPAEEDDDKNRIYVHSESAKAYLSMRKHKISKTVGKTIVNLSPAFATEAAWNLSNWPRMTFFDHVTHVTVAKWLKKTWKTNLCSKTLTFVDIRSSLVSYFLLTHEKFADKEEYARNSMTSMHHMELDYRKVGLPAYTMMKNDLRDSGLPVKPNMDRVNSLTPSIIQSKKL